MMIMGKRGGTKHLKRIAMPQSFSAPRKELTFIKRPLPGRHKLSGATTLSQAVSDLGFAASSREAKMILSSRGVKVDGVPRVEMKEPVGFMDVLTVGDKSWRALYDSKGRIVLKATAKPAMKFCRVEKKVRIPGGKIQLTLHDGRNVIGYDANVGDSIEIQLPDGKPKTRVKLASGSACYIIGGKQVGRMGTIEDIVPGTITRLSEAKCKLEDGSVYTTLKEYLFPIVEGAVEKE